MLVPNRHGNSGEYRYGFNGMEEDDELKGEGNGIDYDKRFYDTRIGRFLSLDPLANKFPWYTPYQFAGNTPLQAIDLDGAEEYHYTQVKDKTGKVIALKFMYKTDIYEWQWNPHKDSDSSVGFYLWEKVKNPRKEYIVHETQNLPIAGRFSCKWQEYDCTATFNTYEGALNAKHNDFKPPFMYCAQVGLEACADSMRDGAVPGKGGARSNSSGQAAPKVVEEGKANIKVVKISKAKYPAAAAHIEEAQASGKPKVLTVNRENADANRKASLKGVPTKKGVDRDEYPPAMFDEGGSGASVKYIPPADNRGAGSSMGNQLKNVPNGTKVKIETTD